MHYIYVCHFSNGHIKVGRSTNPKARIAAHEERVACVGIELSEYHISECVGHAAPAEEALIARCAEVATKRNKNEWFEGLDYLDVCDWADELAKIEHNNKHNDTIEKAIFYAGNATKLAVAIGVPLQSVTFWRKGERRVPADYCPAIERFTAGHVRCEDLRPDIPWGILRSTPTPAQQESAVA